MLKRGGDGSLAKIRAMLLGRRKVESIFGRRARSDSARSRYVTSGLIAEQTMTVEAMRMARENTWAQRLRMVNDRRRRHDARSYNVCGQRVRGAGMMIVQEDGQRFAVRLVAPGSGVLEDELLHGLRQLTPDGKRCAPERRSEVVVAYWHSHGSRLSSMARMKRRRAGAGSGNRIPIA